jgi:hypothetical protein
MSWKKVLLVMAAATAAAYFGARLAAPDSANLALAGGASVVDGQAGLVAVTTGARGGDANRLVVVDTNKKRLLVYGLYSNYMRLIAARPYQYDLKVLSTDKMRVPGEGLNYDTIYNEIMRSKLTKEQKESMPTGRELVLTTDAQGSEGNRIVLINTTEKRILVYRLNRNYLGLISARHYEYDNFKDFQIKGYAPGDGYDYQKVRDMVEAELKRQEKQ